MNSLRRGRVDFSQLPVSLWPPGRSRVSFPLLLGPQGPTSAACYSPSAPTKPGVIAAEVERDNFLWTGLEKFLPSVRTLWSTVYHIRIVGRLPRYGAPTLPNDTSLPQTLPAWHL